MTNKMDQILNVLNKIYKIWDYPFISNFKTLFAWIGLITGLYLIVFFLTIRPNEMSVVKEKEKSLEKNITENEKQISQLNKQNSEIFAENEKLEKELKKSQEQYQNQKKKYEKEISRINSLSNKQLSKLFAESFKEI